MQGNKGPNMSILKVNVNEIKTSIAKNRIFMLSYKETTKTKISPWYTSSKDCGLQTNTK